MCGNAVKTDLNRKERAEEAIALFRQALKLDPDNADAMIGIASTCIFQVVNQFQTEGREALLDEAEALITRAIGLAADHIGVIKARGAAAGARAVRGRDPRG
jgi:tetratricopeptide (TPR) repeat protein